ncbi:hypothetical protein cyc_02838 [Cyclospora cayetanensis]|uniref:DNA 3'-5' helicase n=1 Tax=Cyclospora cayetanensis TaxID=88456 RepID=A0A1D3CZH8_9EIME|nr:hypothetical protein cyc_02838 [Cyclospora cayetanensis]
MSGASGEPSRGGLWDTGRPLQASNSSLVIHSAPPHTEPSEAMFVELEGPEEEDPEGEARPPPLQGDAPSTSSSIESPTSSCYSPDSSLSSVALALYKAGLRFENQGRLAGAIGLYRQAIKLHPGLEKGLVCLDSEDPAKEIDREEERETDLTAERNAGYLEGDVHVDRQMLHGRRAWDAARQVAAAAAHSGTSLSRRRASIKRQDEPGGGAEDAASEETCPLLTVPEHASLQLLFPFFANLSHLRSSPFLVICIFQYRHGFCMSCKSLYRNLWSSDYVWSEKTKAAFKDPPELSLYGGSWRRAFFEAPRLRLDGIYISKCVYLRRELINNLAANSPVIAVTYYRYIRFLPGNKVLVLRSEAEKHVAVGALKCVQAHLEGKPSDAYKAAMQPGRVPVLQGSPLPDQVVLGSYAFNPLDRIVTLEYTGKAAVVAGRPVSSGMASTPPRARGAAGTPSNGRSSSTRGEESGMRRGVRAGHQHGSVDASVEPFDSSPTPRHTAVLRLTHIKGGRWNYRLKWISLSVTSNTNNGPDESFIDVENENFRLLLPWLRQLKQSGGGKRRKLQASDGSGDRRQATSTEQMPTSPEALHASSGIPLFLKKFWGFDGFREGQEEAIQAVLKGNDALVIMPTGGGKSLTYMLPGLLLEGVVLIISPLIALIEDQLRRMKTRGLSACSFNSTLTARQRQEIIAQLLRLPVEGPQQKAIKFLFVTPEQIVTSAFQGVLRQLQQQKQPNGQAQRGPQLLKGGGRGVALIAVDEAHCISSWGHDFRASYRRLGVLRSLLPETPILACTATATAAVQRDICSSLLLKDPVILFLVCQRPNIYYEVRLKSLLPSSEYTDESECLDREGETEFAAADLAREIKEHHPNDLGIVYCLKKKDCETLAAYLSSVGIPAAAYHAGLPEKRRQSLQQRWMEGIEFRVFVATVAFGLGVDNSCVRFVVHFSMTKTIEAFYQESGRAGRDGLPARSILYFSMHDFNLLGFVLQQQHEQQVAAATASATAAAGADGKQLQGRLQQIRKEAAEQHERQMEKLKACVAFCRLVGCRRRYLLEQFGEVYAPAAATVAGIPSGRCCDNCSDPAAAKSRANALRSREVTAASERRKQSWQKAFEARPAALEIETQDVPDGSPSRSDRGGSFFAGRLQRGGRVVYKNTASSERQKIPEDIRKKGLSAVMRELERREEQQETSSSNKKPHHSLFAEFRSAAKLGGSNSRPATAASTRPAVRSDAEALRPATQSFKKTLGLCRPLGLQRTRPSP